MLTKELLRFRMQKDEVKPTLLKVTDPRFQELAETLVGVFRQAVGQTRGEIEAMVDEVLKGSPVPLLVGKGLAKLLWDRVELLEPQDEDFPALRMAIFDRCAEGLRTGADPALAAFRSFVTEGFAPAALPLDQRLYADLPESHVAREFRDTTAMALLHRYNCSQIQGHLIRSQALEVFVPVAELAWVRTLFRHLRFLQLVAALEKMGDEYKITIDGPLSLFVHSVRYGLQLANVFPVLLHLPRWRLEAAIGGVRGQHAVLRVDQKCGIQSHLRNLSAYVPEDFLGFEKGFELLGSQWTLAPAHDFLPLSGTLPCFPDYVFSHPERESVSLELFHPWHARALATRLDQLDAAPPPRPLLLGVSRRLLKDGGLAERCEASPYYGAFGFAFNDIPSGRVVLAKLAEAGR